MYVRDNVLKDLREAVLEVQFKKVDGTNRVMRCTLRPDMLPSSYIQQVDEEKKFHKENENVIAVWEVTKGGWRSFRIDSVEYIQDVSGGY